MDCMGVTDPDPIVQRVVLTKECFPRFEKNREGIKRRREESYRDKRPSINLWNVQSSKR